jgi:cell division transport system permease protein
LSAVARFSHTLRETRRLLRRGSATFVLAVLLTACALVLPLLTITIGYGLAPLAARVPIAPEISVFASLSATSQDIGALKAKLEGMPNVERVQWITRDQSLAELARRTGSIAPLADLKPNPLPDTLVITLDRRVLPDDLDRAASEIRKLSRVDGVYVDSSWYRKAVGAGQILLRVAGFVGLATLSLLGLVVIGAVRLVAMTDRDELRLLRLIGADEGQLARPYAYAGGFALLVADVLAMGAVAALLQWLAPDVSWLSQVLAVPVGLGMLPWPGLLALAGAAFLIGMAGGLLGLRSALRRIARGR